MKILTGFLLIVFWSICTTTCGEVSRSQKLDVGNERPANVNLQSSAVNSIADEGNKTILNENSRPSKSEIKSIDFSNFSFPIDSDKQVKLKNGRFESEDEHCSNQYSLESINYADFTEDGENDALVNLSKLTACGSSATSNYFYIYANQRKSPKLVWRLNTGVQAYGGLKEFRVDNKDLILELYGRTKITGTKAEVDDSEVSPECCPREFTRFRFSWKENNLEQQLAETFPYSKESIP